MSGFERGTPATQGIARPIRPPTKKHSGIRTRAGHAALARIIYPPVDNARRKMLHPLSLQSATSKPVDILCIYRSQAPDVPSGECANLNTLAAFGVEHMGCT